MKWAYLTNGHILDLKNSLQKIIYNYTREYDCFIFKIRFKFSGYTIIINFEDIMATKKTKTSTAKKTITKKTTALHGTLLRNKPDLYKSAGR